MARVLRCITTLCMMTGCTIIKINDSEGHTSINREFGLVSLHLSPESEALLAEIKAVGYVSSPIGYSFGYTSQNIAALPLSCRLIVWVKTKEQLRTTKELLADYDELCPIMFGKNEEVK